MMDPARMTPVKQFQQSLVLVSAIGGFFVVSSLCGFRPESRGLDALAGAILFASTLFAQAIFYRGRPDFPDRKPAFVPEDLAAEALDTRDD
jgi:hypothetical protein